MKPATFDQSVFSFAKAPHRRGPKRTKESAVAHGSRPRLTGNEVAHVTIKLKAGLPSLRRGEALDVVRAAIKRVNLGEVIRIVEFSIQSNHVHLVVEAANSADLSRGMASLNTGLGMRLNRIWGRVGQGSVFVERFHMVVVASPTQVRHLLNYVLRNDVHHRLGLRTLDPCSSAPSFNGWKEFQDATNKARTLKAAQRCVSVEARGWLLRTGWWEKSANQEKLSLGRAPRIAKRTVVTGQVLQA